MHALETFEVGSCTVELHVEDDPISPREWDNISEMVALAPLAREYRRGSIYDRESTSSEDEALDRGGLRLLARYLRITEGSEVVPFTFDDYGSSGARLHTVDIDHDRAAGFFIVSREKIVEEYGDDSPASREKTRRCIEDEAETMDSYVAGEVFGYVVKDANGELIDSCWGFYPDSEGDGLGYLRDEARDMAEYHDRERLVEQEPTDVAEVLAELRR